MKKIITSVYATLDGYIDDPQLWSFDYFNEQAGAYALNLLQECESLLMGRVTYESFAEVWPGRPSDPFSDKINSMPKYAVSSTLEKADWANTTIIKGDDLVEEVTRLKEQPGGDIVMYGTGRLTDTLMEHGLLDEYRIWVHPVLLGKGQPLFRVGVQAKLELLDTTTFDSGVIVLTYRPVK